ncbi:unnamed protein product [Cylicocyclus nassatus]|uniref:Trimethylguanosine synthase n=1 Tax=Cylicocyclus nassatus TaxID=53992 RepID=A0AA36GMA8_CYLNA|nr:unnamed protein product [Cylicocyclus nassatus]
MTRRPYRAENSRDWNRFLPLLSPPPPSDPTQALHHMEDKETSSEEEFKFPWEYLAEFTTVFHKAEDDFAYHYDCCLSRVQLNDRELLRLSEKQNCEPVVDDLAGSLVVMNVVDPEEITTESDSFLEENSKKESLKNSELTKEAWAELPKQFGSSKKDHSRYFKRRKKSHEDAQKWLRNTTFDEYWGETAAYVIYRTWYEDYGQIMNESDRKQLAKQIEEYKPFALLDEHNDENISKYFGLTKDAKFSTYEEAFSLHSDLVTKKAEKDFESFRVAMTSNRCKAFLRKIHKMGFVPGYADEDIISPSTNTISDEVVPKKKTKSESKRRFPVVYGEDEIFSGVSYDICDTYAASMKVVLDRSEKTVKESEASTNGCESEVAEPSAVVGPSNGASRAEISFAFDPNREPHLVAKNAFDYYKDDEEIIKYWYQRYRLFSKLDKGVLMDREGWFSVTPERIAEHIADRIVRRKEMLVVDAFAGVGGNSIQLAIKGARVIAIDLDPVRLKCARENAKVYGVEDRIEFLCCDFFHFAAKWTSGSEKCAEVDAVFLSPPWGGPGYLKSEVFDLDDLTPNGFDIYTAASKMSPNVAYFLPRNTSVKELIALSGPGGRCEIEQSCLNKKIKTLTVYYGNLAAPRGE